jgi:hypothetical protein
MISKSMQQRMRARSQPNRKNHVTAESGGTCMWWSEEEEVGSSRVVVHATSAHVVSMDILFATRVCAG